MSETKTRTSLSRREIAGMAAVASAFAVSPALARQGRMLRALAYCQAGLDELREATPNKGGHRQKAIEHLEYVILQIQEGIAHAEGRP